MIKPWKILAIIGMCAYAWYFKGKLPPVTFERSYFTVVFIIVLYVVVRLFEDQQRYKEPQFVAPNIHFSQINYPIKAGMFSIIEGGMIKINPFMSPQQIAIIPTALIQQTERNIQTKVILWKITDVKQTPIEAQDRILSNWMRYKDCEIYYGHNSVRVEEVNSSKAIQQIEQRAVDKVATDFKDLAVNRSELMEAEASSIRRINEAFRKEGLFQKLKNFWSNDNQPPPPQ